VPVTVTGLGVQAGATILPVSTSQLFKVGGAATIGEGVYSETAAIVGVGFDALTFAHPLINGHAAGEPVRVADPNSRVLEPRRHNAVGERRWNALGERRWSGSA
jgi:hypothetical protein